MAEARTQPSVAMAIKLRRCPHIHSSLHRVQAKHHRSEQAHRPGLAGSPLGMVLLPTAGWEASTVGDSLRVRRRPELR